MDLENIALVWSPADVARRLGRRLARSSSWSKRLRGMPRSSR